MGTKETDDGGGGDARLNATPNHAESGAGQPKLGVGQLERLGAAHSSGWMKMYTFCSTWAIKGGAPLRKPESR